MKQQLTAKLKLIVTPEEFRVLRQTHLAYRDALNYVSEYAFAHNKISNALRLQKETYYDVRARFGVSAQMACNIPRQVASTYQTLWTRVKQNVQALKSGYTKNRYRGLDAAPRYSSPTLTYSYGRDYSLKTGQRVSLLTSNGRLILPYQGYSRHMAFLREGATIGAAKLWYDRGKKRFYLLVSIEIELPGLAPEHCQQVVGVDVGQRYLATVATIATTNNCTQFYPGKEIRAKTDHYAHLRKRLQQKGTRSANRKLVQIAGRERRLKLNANHVISKRILDTHIHALIGLEDLSGIRERTKRKKGKKASRKQRSANRHASSWAFAELHGFLTYKAPFVGSHCVKVDAHYSSQMCPRCGFISQENRPAKGLLFVCQACQYTLHADLVGARNIALRTLLARQDWASTGILSGCPDVTSNETKAARLSQYAELRWSLVASPALLSNGS